ncbi:cupin-like domain-containing protein [Sandaracinobacter sp. RS1-74]|nr:cupin-like domain-containing protein [Sandaracinobacteroides sayramensis]
MLDARKSFRADDPMRALGLRQPAPPAVDDHQRERIAARLLSGDTQDSILADLVREGVPLAPAKAEIEAAAQHPYLKGAALLQARLSKRDWLLESRAKLERAGSGGIPVRDRLPAEDFFAEHYNRLSPVVLTGLTEHWPGRQWTLESLAAKVGNPEIEVQMEREADRDFELNSIAHKRRMRWHEILALLAEDPDTNDFYVTANNSGLNRKALDPLWRDVGDLPGYLGKSRLGDGFFWMGPRGTVTPWHHDLTQNLLVNMVGTKRVALVSPAETHRMRNHRHCFSRFGADATLSDVPANERPRIFTVDIGPGDILFIPVGWWHHVSGLSLTIGMSFINFVWDNDFTSFYRSEGAL